MFIDDNHLCLSLILIMFLGKLDFLKVDGFLIKFLNFLKPNHYEQRL
ncbi:hypothetical protein AO498_08077 [Algoriphagus sanaruensis]|uniref:Uncharacterized protein n=1 Tax=Algoriphagus sanaruensis TaxID=1727163 RepID=A0A142EML3_9BACT|nr:hypothetical protein AO498_08077 [Algoriphagus sanaruensis]